MQIPSPFARSLLALTLLAACSRNAAPRPHSCRVVEELALPGGREFTPVSVTTSRDEVYALSLARVRRGYIALAARFTRGAVHSLGQIDLASSPASITKLIATPAGPTFAVARADGIDAHVLGSGRAQTRHFPRGDTPPRRRSIVPAIALAVDASGDLNALANFTGAFGTRRLHTRDVGESVDFTPRRMDTFEQPAFAIANGAAWLVQQRHAGAFTSRTLEPSTLEIVALPGDPFATPDPQPRVLSALSGSPTRTRVAVFDDHRAPPVLLIAYEDRDRGLFAIAQPLGDPHGPTGTPLPFAIAAAPDSLSPPRLAVVPSAQRVLFAWLERAQSGRIRVVLRSAEVLGASLRLASPSLAVELGPEASMASTRLEVANAGDRIVLAVDSGSRIQAFDVSIDATGTPTSRAIALPRLRGRLIALAKSPTKEVLATAMAIANRGSRVWFVTLPSLGGASEQPPSREVDYDARAIALLDDAVIVAGRTSHGIRVESDLGRRAVTTDSDDGASVNVYQSHADDFVLESSTAPRRVWVAQARDGESERFGPVQSVVLHSYVAELEDGPQAQVRAGVVPEADFDRITFDAVDSTHPSWGTTFSAARERPGECMPGAHVLLYDSQDDSPRASATASTMNAAWNSALIVPEPALRTCDDRVGDIAWDGTRFALTLSGPHAGTRLITGDAATSSVTSSVDLHGSTRAGTPLPGLAPLGSVLAVALYDGNVVRVELRARDGGLVVPATALEGAVAIDPAIAKSFAVPVAQISHNALAVAYPTNAGPRIARIACEL